MLMLNLSKEPGMVLDLNKIAPSMKTARAVLNWDMHPAHGQNLNADFDLDIFVFALNASGKITAISDVVFYHEIIALVKATKMKKCCSL